MKRCHKQLVGKKKQNCNHLSSIIKSFLQFLQLYINSLCFIGIEFVGSLNNDFLLMDRKYEHEQYGHKIVYPFLENDYEAITVVNEIK